MTKEFLIKCDGAPDLIFEGELLASVNNKQSNTKSGKIKNGRWTVLELYRTKGGKFVCSKVGRSEKEGEHQQHTAAACSDEQAVIEFFGQGWLSKALYEQAGIENVVRVL